MEPIDLDDYTPKKRRYLKNHGIYCVYAISPLCSGPTKIGVASDIVQRFAAVLTGNWQPVAVQFLLWTPGRPVAARIEEQVHETLKAARKHRANGWFDIAAPEAKAKIEQTAAELYPAVQFCRHKEMIGILQSKLIDKRDHVHA